MVTVPFHDFWVWVEMREISMHIGGTWWFPLLHSIHVLSVCLMLGLLLMVDLRLMGLAGRQYTVARLSADQLPWVAVLFGVAVLTGLSLFATRAANHVQNVAFQWKMLLLILVGLNMLVFYWRIHRTVGQWGDWAKPPLSARLAGLLSLLLWFGVMLSGRWIGHIFG